MASAETQTMSETDTKRDGYVSYLFSSIRTAKNSPLAAHRAAYARLEIVIRPYKGLAQMRNMEETAAIRGLLLDLAKTANAADIAILELTDLVAALKDANDHYAKPTDRSG